MSLSDASLTRPQALAKSIFRLPLYLYQLGWGPALKWLPLLILTTEGRKSGMARHVVVEYRRHGSKYYIVSGWGKNTDWYKNVLQNPRVTIQLGSEVLDAKALPVDNPPEALSALYMFSRNSWIYETLFARMTSAQAADLSTLADVVDEFTVVRLEPSEETPMLPSVRLFNEATRQLAAVIAALLGLWLLVSLTKPMLPRDQRKGREGDG